MRMRRRLSALLAGLALSALPAVAAAHSEIASSDPAPGASLDEPPAEVIVTFDGELDPASDFSVTGHGGEVVGAGGLDLDVAERNVLRGEVEISDRGVYTVIWTAVSLDGHEESGAYSFGYQADPGAEAADHDDGDDHAAAPDTALPASVGPTPPTLAGWVLLVVAAGLGIGRGAVVPARRRR